MSALRPGHVRFLTRRRQAFLPGRSGFLVPPTPSGSSSPLARYDRWARPAPPAPPERDHCGSFCRGVPFRPRIRVSLLVSVAPVAQWFRGFPWLSDAPPKRHRAPPKSGSRLVSVAQAGVGVRASVVRSYRYHGSEGFGWVVVRHRRGCLRHRASVAQRALPRQFFEQVRYYVRVFRTGVWGLWLGWYGSLGYRLGYWRVSHGPDMGPIIIIES